MIDNTEWMKLVGLVFLGLIASAVFYSPVFILVAIVLKVLGVIPGGLAVNNIGEIWGYLLGIFVVPPIAFFLAV